jgi:hypothetical protein
MLRYILYIQAYFYFYRQRIPYSSTVHFVAKLSVPNFHPCHIILGDLISGREATRLTLAPSLTPSCSPILDDISPGLLSTTELETDLPVVVAEDNVVGLLKCEMS